MRIKWEFIGNFFIILDFIVDIRWVKLLLEEFEVLDVLKMIIEKIKVKFNLIIDYVN